jgi:hypothetical protein
MVRWAWTVPRFQSLLLTLGISVHVFCLHSRYWFNRSRLRLVSTWAVNSCPGWVAWWSTCSLWFVQNFALSLSKNVIVTIFYFLLFESLHSFSYLFITYLFDSFAHHFYLFIILLLWHKVPYGYLKDKQMANLSLSMRFFALSKLVFL